MGVVNKRLFFLGCLLIVAVGCESRTYTGNEPYQPKQDHLLSDEEGAKKGETAPKGDVSEKPSQSPN